jgi:hypothetical protein
VAGYAAVVAVGLAGFGLHTLSRTDPELVVNPSAEQNVSDWQVGANDDKVLISRSRVDDGPGGARFAVDVRRTATGGRWTHALAALRDPVTTVQSGTTYRIRAWVRDLRASDESIGILLASGNFENRPSTETDYGRFTDRSWHLLQRTFTARRDGARDTALYFDLPARSRSRVQITGASVRRIVPSQPPVTMSGPALTQTFDGPAGSPPDPRFWTFGLGGNGWGNNELQTYTSRAANVRQDGRGHLLIVARRERFGGDDGFVRNWTSGRVESRSRFLIPSGSYVEASLRVPTGRGVRPAFWLLGANFDRVGWPASGELDVMEGPEVRPDAVDHGMHIPSSADRSVDRPWGSNVPEGRTILAGPRDERTHRYGVYFDGSVVQFYVDGQPVLRFTREEAVERGRDWPFGQAQHLTLNVAVAGRPDPGHFPAVMVVSRVTVWEGGVPRVM